MPSEIRTHLDKKEVSELGRAATIADDYALTHKGNRAIHQLQKNANALGKEANAEFQKGDIQQNPNAEKSAGKKGIIPTRSHCKKKGHEMSDCWFLEKNPVKMNKSPNALVAEPKEFQNDIKSEEVIALVKKPNAERIKQRFKPFISDVFVAIKDEKEEWKPVKILRDTGASQTLLLQDALPLSEKSSTGASILIQGVGCNDVNVPLHDIILKSDMVSGPVVVGVRPTISPYRGNCPVTRK